MAKPSAHPHRRPLDEFKDHVWSMDPPLPPLAKLVALAVANYMDFTTLGSAFPGAARLRDDTGLSIRCVKAQLRLLVDRGVLVQTFKGGTGRGAKPAASAYRGIVPTRARGARVQGQTRAPDDTQPVHDTPGTRAPRAHHPGHYQGHNHDGGRLPEGSAPPPILEREYGHCCKACGYLRCECRKAS